MKQKVTGTVRSTVYSNRPTLIYTRETPFTKTQENVKAGEVSLDDANRAG